MLSVTDSPDQPTVVFVPHFAGNRQTLHRHIKMVEDLGYRTVCLELQYNDLRFLRKPPFAKTGEFGFGAVWVEQVLELLHSTSGPKILYSLSMPSNSAAIALSTFLEADASVQAWICDGGPFLQIGHCVNNLFRFSFRMSRPKALLTAAASLVWYGPFFESRIKRALTALPVDFPVLSLRGAQDPLVPPMAIDLFFSNAPHLALDREVFPTGGHLDLLKNFADQYRSKVHSFLRTVAMAPNGK